MEGIAMHKKKSKIKVFDFFSGCGGTSEGLREAGMDIVLALDNNEEALSCNDTSSYGLFIN